jgi:sortase A
MQRFDPAKMRNIAHSVWARRGELTRLPEWQKLRGLVVRQRLSAILMLIGVGILGYVGSEYWAMYHEQKVLQREWQEQQKSTEGKKTNVKAVEDDGLTRVSIPKINLDVIVVEGTNHRALRVGPGHLKSTPAPGEIGNSVISAHRDTFFRHIYELVKGDEIQVRRGGRTYTFQVTGKRIVEPSDLSVLKNSPDARLTLITCYPTYYIGPAPERLIVFSKLVGGSQTGAQQAQTASVAAGRQGS